MDDGDPAVNIILFLILLVIDALIYGFGAAIQEINRNNVEKSAEEGDRKSIKLLKFMNNPTGFINTVQLVVTLVNIILGAVHIRTCSVVIERWLLFQSKTNLKPLAGMGLEALTIMSLILSTAFLMYIFLTFAVLSPKKIATKYSEKWAYALVNIMYAIMKILTPLTALVTLTTNVFVRIFGIDPNEALDDVTEEEIISMVNEGHEQGVLQASEAEMITNIFEFGDKEAKDIMTHRKNISAIDGNAPLDQVLHTMLKGKNSRYPVYEDTIDNIIGVAHLKDVMNSHAHGDEACKYRAIKDIEGLIMEAKFIPETRNIDVLFKTMQSLKTQIVIVVDEYGQTAGLIAMEDIIEEIVGNILDEYDEEERFIEEQDDHTYVMEGMTPLDEVEDILEIDFEDEDFETLNGFIISRLDKIPEEGEEFEMSYQGHSFKILEVENKIIKAVLVTKLPEKTETQATEEV